MYSPSRWREGEYKFFEVNMKVIVTKDYEEMSRAAFAIIKDIVVNKPDAVLGLATGTTPIGLYDEMARDCKNAGTSYKKVRTVNLDEYEGLSGNDPQSYRYFMDKNLFERIDIEKKNTHIIDGTAKDAAAECERFNQLLSELPQDLQLLGIGSNGHIAFNEPGTPFESETHVVTLAESTVRDNARLFSREEEVPRRAFTMGLKNIMNAKRVLVLANGGNKAKAVLGLVKGEITEALPASILQRHPACTVIVDEAAAQLLG